MMTATPDLTTRILGHIKSIESNRLLPPSSPPAFHVRMLTRLLSFAMAALIGNICSQATGFMVPKASGRFILNSSIRAKGRQSPLVGFEQRLFKSDTAVWGQLAPLIVCGPSGVGKGTIITRFMEDLGGRDYFQFSVSHTTRAPREGEFDGVHYHFVDIDDMKREIDQGSFLEYAEVHGNYYGTSWQALRDIQKRGMHCLLDIDVQGVQRIKTLESEELQPKYVFIAPPSLEDLEKRLVGRGTESDESIARRTSNARSEVQYGLEQGNFNAIVVNDDLSLASKEFSKVVQRLYNLK